MGSELPARCIVLLMSSPQTWEKTHSQTPCTHKSTSKKRQPWAERSYTSSICLKTHQLKRAQTAPPRAYSFSLVYVMTTTDDPQMENNLHLLGGPDDTQTHCFHCGCLLRPLFNETHMMDHIQLWKNNQESPPWININKQCLRKTERILRQSFQVIWSSQPSREGWGYRMISIIWYNFWWSISSK